MQFEYLLNNNYLNSFMAPPSLFLSVSILAHFSDHWWCNYSALVSGVRFKKLYFRAIWCKLKTGSKYSGRYRLCSRTRPVTNLKGRSFLNCDNTARIPNHVQLYIDTVVDDDDADNNEWDPDFSKSLKVPKKQNPPNSHSNNSPR